MFCPRCGSLMNFDSKVKMLRCTRCGYGVRNSNGRVTLSRTISHSEKERMTVIESSKPAIPPGAVLLKGYTRCPRCGSEEVYAWQIQTRAADEPPTTFYKCPKCEHSWREY